MRAPERGEKRRLQELAQQNAELALSSETFVAETKRLRRVEALEELREVLNLESLPIRIECFDISNIQGQEIVGSMVVFEDGIAKKAHYRKFAVRGLDGQDDFAAMAEVVSRRFARLAGGVTADDYDESFAAAPNLVVIDGGKGQLSAALAAMQAYDLPRVAVIALAKRVEEVFLPGRPTRSCCPTTRPASSSCSGSATRRTGSRSPSIACGATRRRASRCSTRSRASARPAAGRCCGISARPSASWPRARRSWKASPASPRRRRGASTRSCIKPVAPEALREPFHSPRFLLTGPG